MKMIDVMVIGSVIGGLVFFLMGIPFLTGMLLRVLIKRFSAGRVAFLAAFLVFAAQVPSRFASGDGPFAHGLSQLVTNKISIAAAQMLEVLLWLTIGIGLPFIFATWGAELTDRLRKRKGSPNQASHATSEPAPSAASSAHEG